VLASKMSVPYQQNPKRSMLVHSHQ
jgi:hypothetical protein